MSFYSVSVSDITAYLNIHKFSIKIIIWKNRLKLKYFFLFAKVWIGNKKTPIYGKGMRIYLDFLTLTTTDLLLFKNFGYSTLFFSIYYYVKLEFR